MNTIENQHWSREDKQLLISIFQSWNLTNEKQQILRQQIQQMKQYSLFLTLLLDSNQNWETLQVKIRENQQQLNNLDIQNLEHVHHPPEVDTQLLAQFQALNGKSFAQEFNLVMECFQLLFSDTNQGSSLDMKNMYFSNFETQTLQIEDLIQLCIGVRQIFSYYPRQVQLMSVVILFNHKYKGRLAQIYTGEGKTLIVAMLAVLLCKKKNCNVDIVTSSSVLAERDSKDYAQFYKYFKLTVSHNIHKDQIIKDGVLPCYNCQIIYGDASSFQADILRHDYSEQGTMGNRQQQYAIIDEVDSMLIDGHRNKTLLSAPIPGMLDLCKALQLIWDEIRKIKPFISTDFKVMITDKDDYYSVDLEEYLEKTLTTQLEVGMKELIPRFRQQYINHVKKTWIKNAITAEFYLKENKDYVVRDGLIRIVDYQNTGVIQSGNTQWEKGLHQFLQLKHNLNITPLSITTNYLSNVSFFKRYGSSLLGLTGTLGSRNTQNLLARQYNVDFIFVPPFKRRNLVEESSQALPSEEEWLKIVSQQVNSKIAQNRAVLIINRTIQDVEKIQKLFQQNYNIVKYTDDSQVLTKDIGPRAIVIATNLAGRGTDFITNEELEQNGGLHVIMSFLPQSIRTQEQGFGRTCRQGKNGSASLIVYFQQNLYTQPQERMETCRQAIEEYQRQTRKNSENLLDIVKYFRDQNERYYMQQIEKEMEKLLYEDKCFEKFCQIAKSRVKDMKENRQQFRSLEEKWGLYLEIHQEKGIQIEDIEKFLNRTDLDNPRYNTLEGLEKDDIDLINKAVQGHNEPAAQYYKGLMQLDKKEYNEGAQSLINARNGFKNKIQQIQAFALSSNINQQQIQYYQQDAQIPTQQLHFQISDFEQMENGVFSAPEIPNRLPQMQLENQQVNSDRLNQKANNHIKVYKKVIDNIDEIINTLQNFDQRNEELDLEWVKFLDNDEQDPVAQDQELKDKMEVVNDGPLPRLGKIVKKRKKKNFWKCLGLFLLGLCQFAIGAVISVYSAGAAMPIAKAFIKNGISDMILAVTSYKKGLDIDWKAWGQNKLVDYSTALILAGPAGIKEAIDIGQSAMSSIQKEGIVSFISKFGNVSTQELQKSGATLTQEQKTMIENTNQTLQQVSKTFFGPNLNFQDAQLIAQDIIQDQVMYGTITQQKASEINDLVTSSINQAEQGDGSLKKAFTSMASKYLKAQIGRAKANQVESENQEEVQQIVQQQYNTKLNQVQDEIEDFESYQSRLNNEMSHFSQIIWNCYQQDYIIQRKIITIDLYFDLFCDQLKVAQVNDSKVQRLVRKHFKIDKKDLQTACLNLRISDKQSMMKFYSNYIGNVIKEIIKEFSSGISYSEPLEMILKKWIQNEMLNKSNHLKERKQSLQNQESQLVQQQQLLNQQGNQQTIAQFNQMVDYYNTEHDKFQAMAKSSSQFEEVKIKEITSQLVQNLAQNNKINGNGLSFATDIMDEVQRFIEMCNLKQPLSDLFINAMKQSIQQGNNMYQNCEKFFSILLKQAIEHQILEEIKKFIFESKMQREDEKIMQKFN